MGLIYYNFLSMDVMDIDAAQYASMSMEMASTNQYLQVYEAGKDYLDKPPLLFWLSSSAIKLFGVNNIAYKLFPFIFILLGFYGTFRWTKNHYSQEVAQLSVVILATSQAFFLMINDVRTDGLLFSFVMLSLLMMDEYFRKKSISFLLLAGLASGLAMLTKGPIGLLAVLIPVGMNMLIKKEWKRLFDWKWSLYVLVVAIVLMPMCWGLYQQFDLHPEKVVYGLSGPSGLRFFFWTQSFGRITGEIYWKNDSSFFFFFHTIIWDFFPWILAFIPALIHKIKHYKSNSEWITLSGFLLLFFMFSMAQYKLPHYIYVTLPFASIITADYISQLSKQGQKIFSVISLVLLTLISIIYSLYFVVIFPDMTWRSWLVMFGFIVLSACFYFGIRLKWPFYTQFVIISLMINTLFSMHLYPTLMTYQGTSMAGKWLSLSEFKDQNIYTYEHNAHAVAFYLKKIVPKVREEELNELPKESIIFSREMLDQTDLKIIKTFDDFRITRLSIAFLNPKTRASKLGKVYIYQKM